MTKHLKKFNNHSQFESFIESGQRILHNVSYCKLEDHVHYDNYGVQPSVNNNGYEYVDLGLPSGTLWAKNNVGATEDFTYGDFFKWGDTTPAPIEVPSCSSYIFGQNCELEYNNCSKYNVEDEKLKLDLVDDAAHVNMRGDWVMPHCGHFHELMDPTYTILSKETRTTNTAGDVFGIVITSKVNGNELFIPLMDEVVEKLVESPHTTYFWTSTMVPISNGVDRYAHHYMFAAKKSFDYLSGGPNTINIEKWAHLQVRGIIPGNKINLSNIITYEASSMLPEAIPGGQTYTLGLGFVNNLATPNVEESDVNDREITNFIINHTFKNGVGTVIYSKPILDLGKKFINVEYCGNVTIPESVKNIHYRCAAGISSLTLLAKTPPTILYNNNNVQEFEGDFIIFVPAESVLVYKTAWPNMANGIFAIGTIPTR